MSDDQAQLDGLKSAWELSKAQDDRKNSLITDLFAYIHDLSIQLSESESDRRDKKDVIKVVRAEVEEGEKKIRALKLEKDRDAFASVVVDGDCMPFKDELVKQGQDGGIRTATLLRRAVEKELESLIPAMAHHVQVIVRVYANMEGLAKTYKEMDGLSETTFRAFVRGFNMGDVMCDYVDAGNGKECSDVKVEATIRLHLRNVHCRQILFGGTADDGYARLLGPWAEDEALRSRITLIEGPPPARELADIKRRFCTVSFGDVFRSQKLLRPKRKVSFHITPPATPSVDYASAAARAPSAEAPASTPQQGHAAPGASVVLRNKLGQRVDAPLSYSQRDYLSLKSRKLCNSFHLLGRCYFLDTFGHCNHLHGDRLDAGKLGALRAIARQSPCHPAGLDCSDPDCLLGHRCTRDNCATPTTCKFSAAMHGVDTNIVT